jgi:DNA invertase Pin-like site-specific DNA recombinase
MKAIGYVRVSTDRQAEQGVSLEAQESKIRAMATVQGAELLEVIVDGWESAKNLNRPGLQRLLTLVNGGKVNAVIIAKLDRLTRSVKDLCNLLELFEKRGVALVSVAESLDTASAGGRLVITIMAAVSQWDREAIGERTRDALRHKRASGERVGNIRFGSRLSPDGKHVEPDPRRAGRAHRNPSLAPVRAYAARDRCRLEPPSAPNPPWFRMAAGARSANHQAGNRPSLIQESWPPVLLVPAKPAKTI